MFDERIVKGKTMTSRHIFLPMLVATLFVGVLAARGEEGRSPAKTWQDAAHRSGLSAESISSLAKNRILITNDAYKQIFSAYLSSNNPLFITSDSLLNAYHVLYEESVLRLEEALSVQLPPILRLILKNIEDTDRRLSGKPALVSAAKRRAVLVTGVALKLMDDSFGFKDDALNQILTQESRRIVQAEGFRMPAWLGKPDASFEALDYSRYKPRGFYTRSERLKQYFRAVSWLQSIPFRVKHDEEFLAVLMLGNCVTYYKWDDPAEKRDTESFFRTYRSFIGAGDDWDLMTAAQGSLADFRLGMDLNGDDLQKRRARAMKMAQRQGKGPQINDQIRFAPEDPQQVAEPNFRIISAYRTPSAVLFQRTTDIRRFNRPYPDGLELTISLGSAFARKMLEDSQKADLLQTIDACKALFQGSSLYLAYLDALSTLVDAPEHDAPAFMKTEAWQAKSCNTVLAAWAQLRHTWVLQAKQNTSFRGKAMVPAGLIEPEPEFFGKMAQLAEATQRLLKRAGVFDQDYGRVTAIAGLERLGIILEGVKDQSAFRERLSAIRQEGSMALDLADTLMSLNRPQAQWGSEAFVREQRQWIKTLIADIKKGQSDRLPRLMEIIQFYEFDLEDLWGRFEKVSRRLEAISHKQLRAVDLNQSDVAFIKGYGKTIGGIMLHGGNSYLDPTDDAPRVVDVYADPDDDAYLHVGIARPRKMFVLYPWRGKTVLCEGAILPYYEFVNTSRLTDESWKTRLDSEKRPSIPKWVSPIVSRGRLSEPSLKEDY